jgi:hypothetical protein
LPSRAKAHRPDVRISERQNQSIEPDGPANTLTVPTASGDLFLRPKVSGERFEAVLHVVAEPSSNLWIEAVRDSRLVQSPSEDIHDLLAVGGSFTSQELDTDLREFSIATSLRALVTIAARYVEQPNRSPCHFRPAASPLLLHDARDLGNEAYRATLLVLERVELIHDLWTAFRDEGLLFPDRRYDDLFIARVDEGTSAAAP